MKELNHFMSVLTGNFDNQEQFEQKEKAGIAYPYARHVNTICNDKIRDLPDDFQGIFMVEESYYTMDGQTRATPHLFLFTQEGQDVQLTSYELPDGYDKDNFTYQQMKEVSYKRLNLSEKFTPAIYHYTGKVWEGGSDSMFSPVLKFHLFERFCEDYLEVDESMEVRGKKVFGFDEPIIYKRK